MVSSFLSIYTILHLFFFSLVAYILRKFNLDIATQLEYRSFRFLMKIYLYYVCLSVTCTLSAYTEILMPLWAINLIWHLNLLCQVTIALSLYIFAIFRHAGYVSKYRWFTPVSTVPFVIIFICIAGSLFNGSVLSVTEEKQIVYGPAFLTVVLLSMVYFVAILLFALVKYRRSFSYIRRKQLFVLCSAVLFVFASVTVDTHYRDNYMSVLPAAAMCAIVYIYTNMQESSIYTDVLTGMNNRRKAGEYLSTCLQAVSKSTPLYIYMCDVNSFKKINDGFGHAEGDRALVLAAGAIKAAVAKKDGFAARFGGDEFILAWSPTAEADTPEAPEALIRDIGTKLTHACDRAHKPYSVTLSFGYVRCTDPHRSLSEYIRDADKMLYERKRAYHSDIGRKRYF